MTYLKTYIETVIYGNNGGQLIMVDLKPAGNGWELGPKDKDYPCDIGTIQAT